MFTIPDWEWPLSATFGQRSVACAILVIGLTVPPMPSRHSDAVSAPVPSPDVGRPIAADPGDPMSHAISGMRYGLAAIERDRYRRAFAAIDSGNWAAADATTARLEDRRLAGHLRALHYLAPNANPSFEELRDWLSLYRTLPETDDIVRLAQSIRPSSAETLVRAHEEESAPPDTRIVSDIAGSMEPRNGATDRAAAHFFAHDYEGTLSDALRAIKSLGEHASTSHWFAGLADWQLGRYPDAGAHFEALAQSSTASTWMIAAGDYWAARVAERRGDIPASEKWYIKASRYRTTFYGMLAMRKLGIDIAREISGESLTSAHLDALAETPAGYRAVALLEIGRRDLAAQELERIDPNGDPRLEEALLVVSDAARLGELSGDLARRASLNTLANPANMLPIPPWQPQGGFRIDPALMYAVALQESAFDPKAVSPAGAAGLMQIMPRTAESVGGNALSKSLFDPATNLELGQRYLTTLMGDPAIGENLLLLAIAYNAGSGNRLKLRSVLRDEDPLIAIESVKIDETRWFIQHVLANYWIYLSKFGRDTSSLTDLAYGHWPLYRWEDASASNAKVATEN